MDFNLVQLLGLYNTVNFRYYCTAYLTGKISCFLSADITTVLCDNQSKAETLLQSREKGQTPVLKTIIIMDPFNSELVERGTKCGVDIVSMQDVEVLHAEHTYWGVIACVYPGFINN